MKTFILLTLIILPFFAFCQGLEENQIPFYLNSDMDSDINVIDIDDDNDMVEDNIDVYPLDETKSSLGSATQTIMTSADAGLRINNNSGDNNYDLIAEMKGPLRSFLMQFSQPSVLELTSATLTFYSDTEDDALEVYLLPFSNWDETTITYNSTDFTDEILLGITSTPTGAAGAYEYTFDIPIESLPANGADFSIRIIEPQNDVKEYLFTKEAIGIDTAAISYEYTVIPEDRIWAAASSTKEFLNDGPFQVNVKLLQFPTDTVYVPFQISNDAIADFSLHQVLKFDDTNWNVEQTIQIDPVNIGSFDLWVRPLHSNDIFYNGHNPNDLESFNIQATDITNLSGISVTTGTTLSYDLMTISAVGATIFDYRVIEAPYGLNVIEYTGHLAFSPLNGQIGTHPLIIEVTDEFGNVSILETTIAVLDGGVSDPVGIFVVPYIDQDPLEDGSVNHPYNDISEAVDSAVVNGGDVIIRGGEYNITDVIFINAAASEAKPVIIKPMNGEIVKFNFDVRAAFQFTETSKFIELEGVEIDGNTNELDFWCIVSRSVWGDLTVPRGGGLAVIANGENLNIRNNYIHDAYQKGVEITGRYITIEGNVIHNIATTSISGGHGIMRQQQGREFFDDDDPDLYRWDINGNMLFNIEQRIYSWVPSKGYMEMVIDEGKPILIDDPKDSDMIQEEMKARIKNNVVAFGSVDHIRLKSTPNLEVSNNSVFAETEAGDGITDKHGDTDTPQFVGFKFTNNIAQTNELTTTALEINTAVDQATAAGETPTVWGNYAAGGKFKPDPYTGLTELPTDSQAFVDPINGNFRLNPALNLPDSLGVDTTILNNLADKAEGFGIVIKWDGWITDNMKLSQTILDNMPGVRDGIMGNDSVMIEGSCHFDMAREHLNCDLVDSSSWKMQYNVHDTIEEMEFRLNELYTAWYVETETAHSGYERIRWGNSYLKQDQVFEEDWLLHTQITANTNTVIEALDNSIVLDGDLLIDFEGITPIIGDHYDLIIAQTIVPQTPLILFDSIIYEGATPDSISLVIVVRSDGKQALRLTIENPAGCSLIVTSKTDNGTGSLREAISCAQDGDTIRFDPSLINDTIFINSTIITVEKTICIYNDLAGEITISSILPQISELPSLFSINNSNGVVSFNNLHIVGGFGPEASAILNMGNLTLNNVQISNGDNEVNSQVQNGVGSVLNVINSATIED